MMIDQLRKEASDNEYPAIWGKDRKIISQETIAEGRWTRRVRYIVQHDDEDMLVGVEFDEGLTEYQDVDDLAIEVYQVTPRKVTRTVYDRVYE